MIYSYSHKPNFNLTLLSIIFILNYKFPNSFDSALIKFEMALEDNYIFTKTQEFKRNCGKQSIRFARLFKKETNARIT